MDTSQFIFNNVVALLTNDNRGVSKFKIISAANKAKAYYNSRGNFKGKAFDICYQVAKEELKRSIT